MAGRLSAVVTIRSVALAGVDLDLFDGTNRFRRKRIAIYFGSDRAGGGLIYVDRVVGQCAQDEDSVEAWCPVIRVIAQAADHHVVAFVADQAVVVRSAD